MPTKAPEDKTETEAVTHHETPLIDDVAKRVKIGRAVLKRYWNVERV